MSYIKSLPRNCFSGKLFDLQHLISGDLSVALSIPLLAPQFYCPFQATLLNMPFASLNALIGAKNNVRIDGGFADKITVKAKATNGSCGGLRKAG